MIQPLEAQLVQLLAAAVGAGLARQHQEAEAAPLARAVRAVFLVSTGESVAGRSDTARRRDCQITALFSDIRGFSGLVGATSPRAETCRLVGDVMERLTARHRRFGGVVVDYIGDGLLAMWNAPAIQADHAALACRAGLAMLDELPSLNEDWQADLGQAAGSGAGSQHRHRPGGKHRQPPTIQIRSVGTYREPGQPIGRVDQALGRAALVSASTWKELAGTFATRRLCRVRVAGIASPLDVYELHSAARRPAVEEAVRRLRSGAGPIRARRWAEACRTLYPLVADRRLIDTTCPA